MLTDLTLALLFLVLVVVLIVHGRRLSNRVSAPGPAGVPFVGVAWRIPSDKQWLKFHDWIKRYGKFLSAMAARISIFVLEAVSVISLHLLGDSTQL